MLPWKNIYNTALNFLKILHQSWHTGNTKSPTRVPNKIITWFPKAWISGNAIYNYKIIWHGKHLLLFNPSGFYIQMPQEEYYEFKPIIYVLWILVEGIF